MTILLTWWPTIAYTAVLLALVGIAAKVSGPTGLRASGAVAAEQLATLSLSRLRFDQNHVVMALADLAILMVLLWISSRTAQRWPVLAAALQTLTTLGRLARLLDPRIWPMAAAITISWTAWPLASVVAIGIWLDRRRASTT